MPHVSYRAIDWNGLDIIPNSNQACFSSLNGYRYRAMGVIYDADLNAQVSGLVPIDPVPKEKQIAAIDVTDPNISVRFPKWEAILKETFKYSFTSEGHVRCDRPADEVFTVLSLVRYLTEFGRGTDQNKDEFVDNVYKMVRSIGLKRKASLLLTGMMVHYMSGPSGISKTAHPGNINHEAIARFNLTVDHVRSICKDGLKKSKQQNYCETLVFGRNNTFYWFTNANELRKTDNFLWNHEPGDKYFINAFPFASMDLDKLKEVLMGFLKERDCLPKSART